MSLQTSKDHTTSCYDPKPKEGSSCYDPKPKENSPCYDPKQKEKSFGSTATATPLTSLSVLGSGFSSHASYSVETLTFLYLLRLVSNSVLLCYSTF